MRFGKCLRVSVVRECKSNLAIAKINLILSKRNREKSYKLKISTRTTAEFGRYDFLLVFNSNYGSISNGCLSIKHCLLLMRNSELCAPYADRVSHSNANITQWCP